LGREPFVSASYLLANTTKLLVATGIANIYARDAMAAVNGQYGLNEQSGGRFLLGIGVSHVPLVEGLRGHSYGKPLATMRAYLEGMAAVSYASPPPPEKPLTVLAALGPKMLALASELADGAHPYNCTPAHTARAREILGPGKLLCPEQKVLLETDAATARAISRRMIGHSFASPNYRNNYLRMGFTEGDLAGQGSDRLIDSIIAWGDEDAIRARIQEHWDAGADHVCIQPLPREGMQAKGEDFRVLELLAPGG